MWLGNQLLLDWSGKRRHAAKIFLNLQLEHQSFFFFFFQEVMRLEREKVTAIRLENQRQIVAKRQKEYAEAELELRQYAEYSVLIFFYPI